MSDISSITSPTISDLMSNIQQYKYNPSGIQQKIFEYLDEVSEGKVNVVDPTNPFVFLLEASAVTTAVAINENVTNLRRQYPSLAQTEDDLYLHMCDKDYTNRFASPATGTFSIVLSLNDILNKLYYDDVEDCYKATIPRDSYITVDNYVFTLQYPIDIRRYSNGIVLISYDEEVTSPLQTLTTNIIEYTVRRDPDGAEWLFVDVPIEQFKIHTSSHVVNKASIFNKSITFDDMFYYCRVYYKNNTTGSSWVEMKTTHTEQVFDPFIPTAILKVYNTIELTGGGVLNITIPPVYLNTGLISGSIRVDIYSTKGELTLDFSNYLVDMYTLTARAIDEVRDKTVYVSALNNVSMHITSSSLITGGSDALTFTELRERVIYNSIGDRNLPVTNVQVGYYIEKQGFDFVKNIDVVTNRIFLATKKLPIPTTKNVLTSANIGISTVAIDFNTFKDSVNVIDNGDRLTLRSGTLLSNHNGDIRIVSNDDLERISLLTKANLVEEVNTIQYQYTPYYYILDTTNDEFSITPIDLDRPEASMLSFINQNQTLQMPVNTSNYWCYKTKDGFKFVIEVKSGTVYKDLKDSRIGVQLAYYSKGESNLAYINGKLLTVNPNTNERVFEFDILTNHDMDEDGNLCITNGVMFTSESIHTWIPLETTFHIIHVTDSVTTNFIPDYTDNITGKFILGSGFVGNTHETIKIKLGDYLDNLWSRSRTYAGGLAYMTYKTDLPAYYEETVYQRDPVTGSIVNIDPITGKASYTILHQKGDPVLDDDGEPVYIHRKGDVVYDKNDQPVVDTELTMIHEVDLLVVDGRYSFTTNENFKAYKNEIAETITTWIVKDLDAIQDVLLEQTKIYFYPKTTLGKIRVTVNNSAEDYIDAEQSLTVDLYVNNAVFTDNDLRKQLESDTISKLDTYITEKTINITKIIRNLSDYYGDTVTAMDIRGLGGIKDYKLLTVTDDYNRLCLRKELTIQDDGELVISDSVTINFYNTEKIIQ